VGIVHILHRYKQNTPANQLINSMMMLLITKPQQTVSCHHLQWHTQCCKIFDAASSQ